MRTVAQAKQVADATGGTHLPGRPDKDGCARMSHRVDVGEDFEVHRREVEDISPLFTLWDTTEDKVVEIPSGWMVTGAKFEVEWPHEPERRALVRSHFKARRKAYNWALAQIKADMDAKALDGNHNCVPWTLAHLRKEWNRVKDEIAPWWNENSKETYSSGIADLITGLSNKKASKKGVRKGQKVGFPRFSSKRKDHGRVRFTTGVMRLEDDRRHITLPVIGALRSKENTRSLQRLLSAGRARILNMTLSTQWGRLFVSVNYAICTTTRRPVAKSGVRAGVDLGLRTLATVADTERNMIQFPNPTPLRATLV